MQSFTGVFKKALFIMALCTVLIPSATHAVITKTVTATNEDPTVTIIAPNGGESFTEGQQITVRWSTVGIPATQKVGFDLYTNQDTIKGYTLFNVSGQDLFDNDGQETLVIPSIRNNFTNWNYGNYFKIKMAVDNPDITAVDYSDSTFSISSVVAPMPSIHVISPNSGESYIAGQQIPVTWESANLPASSLVDIVVQHHYPGGNGIAGANYAQNLTPDGTSNDGTQVVTLPTQFPSRPFGRYFKILVIAHPYALTNTVYDVSDNLFTIQAPVSVANPAITVLSPNGGESYVAGQQIQVKWETANFSTQNNVFIGWWSSQTNQTSELLIATPNDGQETVILPTSSINGSPLPSGNYYKIYIALGGNPALSDKSDNTFTIQNGQIPAITVLSPNGGETLVQGQSNTISWRNGNGYTKIGLMSSNATLSSSVIGWINTNVTPGTTSITWNGKTVTDLAGTAVWTVAPGQYKIIASGQSTDGTGNYCTYTTGGQNCNADLSDTSFTIAAPTSTTPSITVVSPNGGEMYQTGQQIVVRWTTNNAPSDVVVSAQLANTQTGYELVLDSMTVSASGIGTINDGQEIFILPANDPSAGHTYDTFGNNFKMRLYISSSTVGVGVGQGIGDYSDDTFTINPNGTNLPAGCTSTAGYSTTSGQPCNLPEGCMAPTGFSTSTGQPCTANGGRPVRTPSVGPDPVAVKASFTRELKLGASGADVTALQNRLKTEGVYTSPITGYFGKMTQAALKKFQTKYGIPAVGAAGPRTLQVLNK